MTLKIKSSGLTRLSSKNIYKPIDFFYILLFLAVPLGITAFLTRAGSVWLYAAMAIVTSATVFFVRSFTSGIFDIKLSYKPWFPGLIFSAIATLIISIIVQVPVPIPIMNASQYKRAATLRGLKKGEIKNKDKWEVSMFSFLSILAMAQLLLNLGAHYGYTPLFYAGIMLTVYILIDILPIQRFNGAFMVYHNTAFYFISAGFITIMFILSYLDALASSVTFVIFLIASFVAYSAKLW